MVANSAIEWTDHTFSPWWGCTDFGPGCKNCYAEGLDRRYGGDHWGKGAPRRLIKDWSGPVKWNRQAEAAGVPAWVFIASMCDVFDPEVDPMWRTRLWDHIRPLKHLRIQIVTKRIRYAAEMLPADWIENFGHCGIIATVVTQKEADRDIPLLLETPARWRGLSMEPLLERVSIRKFMWPVHPSYPVAYSTREEAEAAGAVTWKRQALVGAWCRFLDWVIVGGESSSKARPFDLAWPESIVTECTRAHVPVFVKQLGDNPMHETRRGEVIRYPASKKGKDMSEWPEALRVRQMPRVYEVAA